MTNLLNCRLVLGQHLSLNGNSTCGRTSWLNGGERCEHHESRNGGQRERCTQQWSLLCFQCFPACDAEPVLSWLSKAQSRGGDPNYRKQQRVGRGNRRGGHQRTGCGPCFGVMLLAGWAHKASSFDHGDDSIFIET